LAGQFNDCTCMNWDENDLVKRLCRALDITKRSITLFSERGYVDNEVIENSFRPDKPIAEATMLVYAASGASDYSEVALRINDLTRLLAPLARSKRIMLSMSLHPALCVEFAVPHILLTKLGVRHEQFDHLFALCLQSQASMGHERQPFAALERSWILSLWCGGRTAPDWKTTLRLSALNAPIDMLGGLKEDLYAWTHLVIYCTNFGYHVKRLPRSRSVILAETRSLLAKCLDEEDYDLAAELLMVWPQLGATWCASSAFAFRVLTTVENQVGVLPSVKTKSDRLNKLEGDDKARYAFATAYHTALVMGLLCAVSLREGRLPPTRIAGKSAKTALIDQLLSYVDTDQGHWQPIFSGLPELERSALAPLILDIALAQNFRRRDYDAANKLLMLAASHGMVQSPLALQAAEMLDCLVSFYGAAGANT
jgi:hypothetical protein